MRLGFLVRFVLGATLLVANAAVFAQGYRESTIALSIPNGSLGFSLSQGEVATIKLPQRLFVHKVLLQVDSINGNSGAELLVNGDRKGNVWLTSDDPLWTVTVEQETMSIQVVGTAGQRSPQGKFVVRAAHAVVSDTDWTDPGQVVPTWPTHCTDCNHLPFPTYYTTVMGNVSNRAIMLVDRLTDYANYRDYGVYLLPVKKSAAQARAVAEARGDASGYARGFYVDFLRKLDHCEPYFSDTFERGAAFELGTELLALREHIRDILD